MRSTGILVRKKTDALMGSNISEGQSTPNGRYFTIWAYFKTQPMKVKGPL